MRLNEFVKKLYSKTGNYGNVVSVTTHYEHQIIKNEHGDYYIDGVLLESKLNSLEEVREYINLQESAKEARTKIYEELSQEKIANIIKKHNENTKITTSLIESYITLASSKKFTVDPVLFEMREINRSSRMFQNKIDFLLNDEKTVAISEDTYKKIENLLNNKENRQELINYMRENANNFLSVIKQL
jgi:hypothetical protein